MDENNDNLPPTTDQSAARPGRGLLVAHIINLILIIGIFLATHYFLSANQCTPEVAFRWSVLAAALYGLLSTLLVSSWLSRRRNRKA